MEFRIEPLTPAREPDFRAVMAANGCSRTCLCTANYIEGWEVYGAEHRAAMFARGESDGFLLYADDEPAAWCQCTPIELLRWGRALETPAGTHGIGCIVVARPLQRRGLCRTTLEAVLERLAEHGCPRVVVQAHRREAYDDPDAFLELPASVCEAACMSLLRDHVICPLYEIRLEPDARG